jgi:WD40 repeat protein
LLGTRSYTLQVWDAQTGKMQLTLKGHTAGVRSVAFSPNGKRIASAGGWSNRRKGEYWGEVKVWNVQPPKAPKKP